MQDKIDKNNGINQYISHFDRRIQEKLIKSTRWLPEKKTKIRARQVTSSQEFQCPFRVPLATKSIPVQSKEHSARNFNFNPSRRSVTKIPLTQRQVPILSSRQQDSRSLLQKQRLAHLNSKIDPLLLESNLASRKQDKTDFGQNPGSQSVAARFLPISGPSSTHQQRAEIQ